jgi:hypothetical protein
MEMYLFTKNIVNHLKKMWDIVNERTRHETDAIRARKEYIARMTAVKRKGITKKKMTPVMKAQINMWK